MNIISKNKFKVKKMNFQSWFYIIKHPTEIGRQEKEREREGGRGEIEIERKR